MFSALQNCVDAAVEYSSGSGIDGDHLAGCQLDIASRPVPECPALWPPRQNGWPGCRFVAMTPTSRSRNWDRAGRSVVVKTTDPAGILRKVLPVGA